jgi:hypothetical protein
MPWLMRLFEEIPRPQNGELVMPTAPGLALKFDQATLDRYRVAYEVVNRCLYMKVRDPCQVPLPIRCRPPQIPLPTSMSKA